MGMREGCTIGYWRNHPNSWGPTGYHTNDLFRDVFGRTLQHEPDATLIEALSLSGQPNPQLNSLARQAVAALLNAAHPEVHYPLSTGTVITKFQKAFDDEDYEPTKDKFDAYNNLYCPLS